MENFVVNLVTLVISNVLLGSLLVLLTKASGSVIPAAITHALTNVVPGMVMGFFVINEPLYQANFWGIYLVTLIPDVLIAVVCYIVLKYKKMLCNVA